MQYIHTFFQVIYFSFRPPWRVKDIFHHIVQIGVSSLPVIVISTVFAGMVISSEIAWHMNQALHTLDMVPGFTGQFIFRELGISIPALLLVSKVGASIAAEVATMKVTEQIDALRLLRIQPICYLIVPRFIAAILSGACLTLIAIFVTLSCALIISVYKFHFGAMEYINSLRRFISHLDILFAILKGMIYGGVVPIIGCTCGLNSRDGAEGVGSATTQAVVVGTMVVICLDFILTYIFTKFY